jgi:hypothetical protein
MVDKISWTEPLDSERGAVGMVTVPACRRARWGPAVDRPVLHRNEAVCGLIRRAVACEDAGQFDFYPCRIRAVRMRAHGALAAYGVRPLQQIERRGGHGQVLLREVKVARRGGEIAVSQQALNGVHINTAFE